MKFVKKNITDKIINVLSIKNTLLENKVLFLKFFVIFILVIISLVTVFGKDKSDLTLENNSSKEKSVKSIDDSNYEEYATKIVVDISGEVINPMVLELDEGSRINDAIKAAGGITKNADITNINRAAPLSDGEKIYIPSKEEGSELVTESDKMNSKININLASSSELTEIPGVGTVTAASIISYRDNNGKFKQIEDIILVDGIGEKTFSKMKDKICI